MRLVNLVNDSDEVVGHTDLLDAHRGSGKKHQAISWFLFCRVEGRLELLLQQRSAMKIVGATQWANTLCANLVPNETHEQCLHRRAKEELGLTWSSEWVAKEVFVLDYQVACENGFSECEIDHFFVTLLDDNQANNLQVNPNPQEVAEYLWCDWEQVKQLKVEKDGQQMEITPWTKLFLSNPVLVAALEQTLA